ncbi:MAG: hypothetical protein KF773_19565 [Deltaproteobacteria bacterium]|nr:hypothetical protein [Deltaproteobacteria bacterium]
MRSPLLFARRPALASTRRRATMQTSLRLVSTRRRGITASSLLLASALAACGPAVTVHPERAAPTCGGDIVLVVQADVAGLAGCMEVSSLEIRGDVQLGPLGRLASVTGDLVVRGAAIGELALPRLARVGGAIVVADNPNLRGVALPALARAARLELAGNAQLATIDVGRATFGTVELGDNAALPADVAGALRSRAP